MPVIATAAFCPTSATIAGAQHVPVAQGAAGAGGSACGTGGMTAGTGGAMRGTGAGWAGPGGTLGPGGGTMGASPGAAGPGAAGLGAGGTGGDTCIGGGARGGMAGDGGPTIIMPTGPVPVPSGGSNSCSETTIASIGDAVAGVVADRRSVFGGNDINAAFWATCCRACVAAMAASVASNARAAGS